MSCVLCGSGEVQSRGIAGLRPGSVTSDSRPCALAARIWQCRSCGHLQKVPDVHERSAVDSIYAAYEAHHLSGGREQLTFVPGSAPRPRSQHALLQLRDSLPETGRLLDVGTGAGAILASAHAVLPEWQLYAFDVSERQRAQIERRPQVRGFYAGDLNAVPDLGFDLIVLWHVLEHLPDPASTLCRLRARLAPGGHLLIQVPDIDRNAYDLAVIDHVSHFSAAGLLSLARACGFETAIDGRDWFHNCLTIALCRGEDASEVSAAEGEPGGSPVDWLRSTVAHFDAECGSADYAIFGTGMAGIWLAGQLQRPPAFFVDEDSARWGHEIAGTEIVGPADVPPGVPLMMAFDAPTGCRVSQRLRHEHESLRATRFVIPNGARDET